MLKEKYKKITIYIFISSIFSLFLSSVSGIKTTDYKEEIIKLERWLLRNRDKSTFLPYSHVGDQRFENWTITYDSAVVTLAYIATGQIGKAKKIIDFYIKTPGVWRLDGIIEAVNSANSFLGEDWSVRSGSNMWIALASLHLYLETKKNNYLDFSRRLTDFVINLQNADKGDYNFGGVRLGPLGGENVAGDQHLNYDLNQPRFYDIYSTEHNIDAYALFNIVYQITQEDKYKNARDKALRWLKMVGFNQKEHRFNRGYSSDGGLDECVATDTQSLGISALGVETLNSFESNFAERIVEFVERNCLSSVSYVKPDGEKVVIKGVDFIDKTRASKLGRRPLVTPEWTFQLINAYRRLEKYYIKSGDNLRASKYKERRKQLIDSMLSMAIEDKGALAYPYATEAEAVIGHEYKTPRQGNLSAIGVAYGILALSGYDPLYIDNN